MNKKKFFFEFLEFYSRWKGLLAPDTKTHFQTTPICPMQLLFLLLAVRFYLQMPLEGPRGRKMSPKSCFWGRPPSDMTVIYHLLAHYSASTTPGQVFRPFLTKSELWTLPRDWFTSKKALSEAQMSPNLCFWGDVPEWYDRLLGPAQLSYNIRGVVPPILDQVWPLDSS